MRLTRRSALRTVGIGIGTGGFLMATSNTATAQEVLPVEISLPSEADVGEEVEIGVVVDMPDLLSVSTVNVEFMLYVDENLVDSTESELPADGEEHEITLEYEFEEPGEREVTVEAEFGVDDITYSGEASDTITIIGETTVSGAVLPSPPALAEDIQDLRADLDDLPDEDVVILNESDATVVLTDSDVDGGTAEATGAVLDSPIEFESLTLDVLVATEFDHETSATEIALDDLSENTDEYAFEYVSVSATHLSTSVRITPSDGPVDFATSTGILVDSGPELSQTFGDIDTELYNLLDEPTPDAVDDLIPADEPDAYTIAFGDEFWTNADVTVTGIVLPPETIGRELVQEADTEDISYADETKPLLYWTDQEYDTTEIEEISTLHEEDKDGEYVSLEADVWGKRVSTKQTMEETTGCGSELVQFERGCIDVIFDVLLHGGAAWIDQPDDKSDIVPLLGISSQLQEVPVDDHSGSYEIVAEVVESSRIHADLPEGVVLLVNDKNRIDSINFDSLPDNSQEQITSASNDIVENWAEQVDVEGETIEVEDQEPSLEDYTDEEGNAEASDVFDAIEDWRNSEIDPDLVFEVIEAWRAS